MMRVVWVKRDGVVLHVPLLQSGQLMLDPLAARWKLDPDSLTAGDDHLLLTRDSKGNSHLTLDEIAKLLPQGNNGLSKQTPLLLTGCSSSSGSHQESKNESQAKRKAEEMETLCQATQARRDALCHAFSSVYEYTVPLAKFSRHQKAEAERVLETEFIPQLVGEVHLVQPDGASTRTGLATLIKPDGTCWTAMRCIKGGELEQGVSIRVKFKSGETIDCKLGSILGHRHYPAVACLVPDKGSHTSFKLCMRPKNGGLPPFVDYLTLDKTMKLVKCISVEKGVLAPVYPDAVDLGAPFFDHRGGLLGIVNNPDLGKLGDQELVLKSNLDPVRRHSVKRLVGSLAEICASPKDYTDILQAVSAHKQLAEFSPITWKTPADEWMDEHPVQGFTEEVAGLQKYRRITAVQPAPRAKLINARVITDEEYVKMLREKHRNGLCV